MVNDRVAARRGRGRAARAHQPARGCATASRWSTRRAPTSTRPSSSSPTCGCCPARSSRAARRSAPGSVDRSRRATSPTSSSASGCAVERGRARMRDRRRLRDRAVRLPAPGHPARGGREGRHVRRGEELRDRRGHEGAAPLLRGRRRHRRRREPRREHDHRELRRRATSTAPRSATACTRASTPRWSRRSSSATAPRPARARSSPTMCAPGRLVQRRSGTRSPAGPRG